MPYLWLYARNLFEREEGQDLVEYAMLFGFIAIIAMLAVMVLGLNLLTQWDTQAALVGGMF